MNMGERLMKFSKWASFAGAVTILALLAGSPGPAFGQAKNLALDATASSSSDWEDGPSFAALKANDGDPTTRWNSRAGDTNDSWLALTWKDPVTFNKIAVDEDFDRVQTFRLEIPDTSDPTQWKPIYDSTGTDVNPTGSQTPTHIVNLKDPVTAKALRFYVVEANTVPTIFEFRVYDVPLGTVTGTVSDDGGKPIEGASVSAGGSPATPDAPGETGAPRRPTGGIRSEGKDEETS